MIVNSRICMRFFLVLFAVALLVVFALPSEARKKSGSHKRAAHAGSSRSHGHSKHAKHGRASSRNSHSRHHGKTARHHRHHHHHVVHKPRYAYPVEMFMMKAPDFDTSPMAMEQADEVMRAFARGYADHYPARTLVRAGVVKYHPLRGGIYWRREPVKHIIMHSTETGVPVSGVRVIESWSSMGRRHPGAQYVVDRDGTIYQAVDPDLATVHINILKTLPGINNDNSIGIEMNHTGSQDYPEVQLTSVIRLVTYLQDRYQVASENIITHRYAQQGDHTDPVRFNWTGFLATKDRHRNQAIAYKMTTIEKQSNSWSDYTAPPAPAPADPASTYLLQPHLEVKPQQIIQQTIQQSQQSLPVTQPRMQSVNGSTDGVSPGDGVNPSNAVRDLAAPTPSVLVKPVPSSAVPVRDAKPSGSNPNLNNMPPLRGPIELGPEQAGDLNRPPDAVPR